MKAFDSKYSKTFLLAFPHKSKTLIDESFASSSVKPCYCLKSACQYHSINCGLSYQIHVSHDSRISYLAQPKNASSFSICQVNFILNFCVLSTRQTLKACIEEYICCWDRLSPVDNFDRFISFQYWSSAGTRHYPRWRKETSHEKKAPYPKIQSGRQNLAQTSIVKTIGIPTFSYSNSWCSNVYVHKMQYLPREADIMT